jgi:C1A family cysteine protease
MNCLMGCACSDVFCALGCVAGKTLDSVSSKVKSCASGCASTDESWEQYKADFKKVYASDDEETERRALFEESLERIAKGNALGNNVFGLTWSSDRRPEEKHAKGLKKPAGFVATAPLYEKKYERRSPESINWRTTDAVTPIKNQGQCGSCWAFSATSAIESQLALSGGDTFSIELSPQQITSCTPSTGTYGSDGCNGGFTEGAYEYVKSAPGLTNSFNIGYEQSLTASSTTVACSTFSTKISGMAGADAELSGGYAQVSGYTYATPACTSGACASQDLDKLKAALEETPVSVCVNAASWNDYTGGVMTSAQCGNMGADYQDHCVMATGFNSTGGYWIVRNSWASGWGEMGYIYLELDENTCGLADDATIPTVKLNLSPEQELRAEHSRQRMYAQAVGTNMNIV